MSKPFALGASLRQLEEVWGLKGDDRGRQGKPVRILKAALLAKVDMHRGRQQAMPKQGAGRAAGGAGAHDAARDQAGRQATSPTCPHACQPEPARA